MPDEAKLERTEAGVVPADDGWFVLNLAELGWDRVDGGGMWCSFESPSSRSPLLGIGVHVLWPGETPGFYHAESNQEGFLVLSGECIAIVEEEERRLRAWDFLHCPPGTRHVFIGTGEEPCVILMVGARAGERDVVYPRSDAALAHGAGVETETSSAEDAYGPFPHWQPDPT